MDATGKRPGALDGVRVLELGQLVAGASAGALLAAHGAEVLKVEPPEGDPLRTWRVQAEGDSPWWRSLARGRRLLAIDLRRPEGQALVAQLLGQVDVLLENFRPGRLEAWGLGPEVLRERHPRLVICRISGHGQDGPRAGQPGYAAVAEAIGGLRHLCGEPGGPTVRPNLSLGDTAAGMQAVIGVLLALRHRDRHGEGQVVDVALAEAVAGLLEAAVPEAALTGRARGPSGGALEGVAPTGAWRSRDGREIALGANGASVFRRLCRAMGEEGLADDPRFADNAARVRHRAALDARIAAWVGARDADEVCARLAEAAVPAGPVQTATDLLQDPQFAARGRFPVVDGAVLPLLGPPLSATPERAERPGGAVGRDTDEVLRERCGLDAAALAALRAAGVVR
jgi:crotonobetainyl-CoA:carnitine CoA-transferase CaiB-like acyl-CoA transferase